MPLPEADNRQDNQVPDRHEDVRQEEQPMPQPEPREDEPLAQPAQEVPQDIPANVQAPEHVPVVEQQENIEPHNNQQQGDILEQPQPGRLQQAWNWFGSLAGNYGSFDVD